VISCLVGEPFCLVPREIAELTDWQLLKLYFCKRDPFGRPVPPETDEVEAEAKKPKPKKLDDFRTEFIRKARVLGATLKQAQEAWEKQREKILQKQAERRAAAEAALRGG
jgi:hypothetical protein